LWADARPEVSGVGQAAPAADDATEADERRVAVRAAIEGLPVRSRLAFVLQFDHHMSNAEIATAMGISTKGVEKLLAIAKRHLRETLGAYAEGDPTSDG
jgi:RNA polymerase sigma-70 factor (ECF subfamily)